MTERPSLSNYPQPDEAAQDAGHFRVALKALKKKKQPKTVEALVSMFVSACFSDAPLAPLHTRTARGE